MKPTEAEISIIDPDKMRVGKAVTLKVKNTKEYLSFRELGHDDLTMPTHRLRRYTRAKRDEDGDPLLLDWFDFWVVSVTWAEYADLLLVRGFMRDLKGHRRDGLCPHHDVPTECYSVDHDEGLPFFPFEMRMR